MILREKLTGYLWEVLKYDYSPVYGLYTARLRLVKDHTREYHLTGTIGEFRSQFETVTPYHE